MSCYSYNASNSSTNDSDCTEQPRDFSLNDSSPDRFCSPLPPPLPLPRMSKFKSEQAEPPQVDGAFTRREPPQEPKDPNKYYREVVDRLALHIARTQGANVSRPFIFYKDNAELNQGAREALNSHYEKWARDASAASAAAAKTRRTPTNVAISGSSISQGSGRSHSMNMCSVRPESKIRTVLKYVEYNAHGNRKESKYIVKMPRETVTLREFKKIMPHTVMRPRFFFSIRANENVELEDDNAKLPIITSEEGEPIIVAEITSKPI